MTAPDKSPADVTTDRLAETTAPEGSTARPAAAPLRRVLALLPEVETVAACLDCAAAAAFDAEAVIAAVHVGFDPVRARVSTEELDIQYLRDATEGAASVRSARIKAAYDAWASTAVHPDRAHWTDEAGDVTAAVVAQATSADLVVIGRPIHLDAKDALRAALFKIRRPVLIAPPRAVPGGRTLGRHIVVGWKPGEPARRAVEAAAPWLRRAACVTVLCVAKLGAEPYPPSARALFARLGIAAEIVDLDKDARSVGRLLLDETGRRGGDALVIGAYHHGQFWEAVLGGVTRDVLASAEIPVFMMR
ncbi:universal stress protein [Siculibacillus lacustris]|uniref:Universal stress protein n=1 Tax=Siculibacillus lacustris TaxID=1549641 RepID=A0A4Q9VIW4_9HYPH|nr:universal stress protein [Siculibacillus lacustris]TBW35096.1 universal stress protein [Siculibacillus lacustris]